MYRTLPEDTLGKRLRKGRLITGMTQNELAQLLNTQRTTIDDYENDRIVPSRNAILELCKYIDKNLIIGEDEYLKFILSDYSKALYEWRIGNNLSVADAAKILDIDRSSIYRWEKGEFVVTRKFFDKIKDRLNLIKK